MTLQIIKVDKHGRDAAGDDYTYFAAPHVVAAGYAINQPTLIQYPNGKVETGNLVKFTPSGVAYIKREMAAHPV
ncbi:hypothetical protein ACO34A_09930 [Rhizobium sp. ACO-34A]|nr:hypothetical protein [Rhizobium sp. ACO-34A]ATN34124.1 hypothetical protein ACO34A_09930 [Rhizobium sp. ACO-34A]